MSLHPHSSPVKYESSSFPFLLMKTRVQEDQSLANVTRLVGDRIQVCYKKQKRKIGSSAGKQIIITIDFCKTVHFITE